MCYDIEKCMKTKNKSRTVPDGRYTCICKYTVGTGTYHPEKKTKKKNNKKTPTFCLSIHRPTLCDEFCVSNVFLSVIFCFWLIYQMQRKLTVSRADPDKQLNCVVVEKFAFNFRHVHRQTSSNSMTVVIVSSDE